MTDPAEPPGAPPPGRRPSDYRPDLRPMLILGAGGLYAYKKYKDKKDENDARQARRRAYTTGYRAARYGR